MNYSEAIEKLYSLQKFGMKLGLDNTYALLNHIGNPHLKLSCFHIAGSNGKGSTSSFIASILQEHGYKTGLYTSPHFIRFNERIRINCTEITDDYIVDFITGLDEIINIIHPTFFEVTTAMSFKYFVDNNVDYAVIETGLGGRLDSTNVLQPLASIITSISLEHTEILGDTLEKIAYEKGGIVKPSSKTFIGRLPDIAVKEISAICLSENNQIYKIEDYILPGMESGQLKFKSGDITLDICNTPLFGNYQKYNAALGILALNKTVGINNPLLIMNGIENVIKNTGIQGRYEVFSEKPLVIFDSAHNLECVENFLSAYSVDPRRSGKNILIFGAMKDKALSPMLKRLKSQFDEIIFTSIDTERCATTEILGNVADSLGIKYSIEENPAEYIIHFIGSAADSNVVFLGSMYILGKIKERLNFKN